MQAKTTGIVLHQVKYSDSSSIVTVYTKNFGRMAYLARGRNKKKSACRAALLQPLSVIEMDVFHNPKKDIQSVKDMRIAVPFYQIPFNPEKNAIALFMAEMLHRTLRLSECDENLYAFIENSILELDACEEGIGNFHLAFLAGLARELGFAPHSAEDDKFNYFDLINGVNEFNMPVHKHFLEGEAAVIFRKVIQLDYTCLHSIPMNRDIRAKVLQNFIDYYRLHLPEFNRVNSVEILKKLWD